MMYAYPLQNTLNHKRRTYEKSNFISAQQLPAPHNVFVGCSTDTAQSFANQSRKPWRQKLFPPIPPYRTRKRARGNARRRKLCRTFGGSTRRGNHHTNCRSTARLQLQYANNRRPLCRLGSVPYKQSHNTGTGHGKRICGVSQRTILSISVLFQNVVQSESGIF